MQIAHVEIGTLTNPFSGQELHLKFWKRRNKLVRRRRIARRERNRRKIPKSGSGREKENHHKRNGTVIASISQRIRSESFYLQQALTISF
jgi:hypothetical protein